MRELQNYKCQINTGIGLFYLSLAKERIPIWITRRLLGDTAGSLSSASESAMLTTSQSKPRSTSAFEQNCRANFSEFPVDVPNRIVNLSKFFDPETTDPVVVRYYKNSSTLPNHIKLNTLSICIEQPCYCTIKNWNVQLRSKINLIVRNIKKSETPRQFLQRNFFCRIFTICFATARCSRSVLFACTRTVIAIFYRKSRSRWTCK